MNIKIGTTDRSEFVFIRDPAQSDWSGKTAVTYPELTVGYARAGVDNVFVPVNVSSLLGDVALNDPHEDWGWKEISSAFLPGWYRLDIADAVFAAGAVKAIVSVMLTSSAAVPYTLEYELGIGDLSTISSRLPPALTGDNNMMVDVQKILGLEPQTAEVVRDVIFAGAVEAGFPLLRIFKVISAMLAGKNTGVGTGTIRYRAIDDSRDCVVIEVLGGNRVNIAFDFGD